LIITFKNKNMKKRTLIIISAVVLVAALAVIIIVKPFGRKNNTYTFETATVGKATISNTVDAAGTLEAITTVEVGTQVSGVIKKINVDFNSKVKQGQLLAELDRTPLLAQLEQSKATVDEAEAELEYQTSNYDRLKALYEKKLIAKTDFDQATYNYNRAKAALSNAKSVYNRNKINLDYATILSPIDGVVLNRAVEEGQTVAASFNTPTLFTIAQDLTQMEVESNVAEADIGMVKFGQRVEFTVDAYPDDKFAGTVSQVRLQPVVTNNVVTYTVVINAPNPEKKLMPGMTANTTIFVQEKSDVLVIPGKALRFTPDEKIMAEFMKNIPGIPSGAIARGTNSRVQSRQGLQSAGSVQGTSAQGAGQGITGNLPSGMTPPAGMGDFSKLTKVWVKEEGNIHPQPVETGINNGSEVEIISGLKEGDVVVLSMKLAESGEQGEKAEFRSPFMPTPPGRGRARTGGGGGG
jgi:HlyD family secretion protein